MVRTVSKFVRDEWFLAVSVASSLAFLLSNGALPGDLARPAWLAFIFLWLFAVMLGSALSVVRHADRLAVRLGEPYGTLILTLSITFIEVVSISAVMVHGENNPTLTRDTLFAVVLSLVLPDFTQTTPGPTLSSAQQSFLVLVAVGLYVAFLAIQTGRHRSYFTEADAAAGDAAPMTPARSPVPHAALLIAYLAPVVFLAEQMAHPIDYVTETLHAPAPLGGVIVALLVATPEAIGAVRAAMANHLQRSVNIFLGSVLSTIGLTVPAMVVISHVIGRDIILGVEHTDLVMLLLTLVVSVVTFASGRTNVIQGAVHLILFAAYLLLIVQS